MDDLQEFLKQYELATNSHDFKKVEPLLAPNAVYWFNDGSFEGIAAIRKAFERTWDTISDEVYKLKDVEWITVSPTTAACIYEFRWQGKVSGIQRSGSGRGTNIMVKTAAGWQMIHEHLSKHPS